MKEKREMPFCFYLRASPLAPLTIKYMNPKLCVLECVGFWTSLSLLVTMTKGLDFKISFSCISGTYSHPPPSTAQDPTGANSGAVLSHYAPLPPIHMPKLRQESRSGKSRNSDSVTHSGAGSPVAGRLEDIKANSPENVNRGLISPEILPVR